jgi:DNA-binding response OmpR family regulator
MSDGTTTGRARPTRVLVVEDAPEFVELLVGLLEREGYDVATAADGPTAVETARTTEPDLIVLDLTLPGLDGVEVCRRIRGFSDAYVLMVTARDDEVDRVVGLEVGADDYLTKPFSPRELVARVRAMLRRPRTGPPAGDHDAARTIGRLVVDPRSRRVLFDGEEVPLTRIEFDLLDALAAKPSMVFSRRMLRDLVWGEDWYGDDHVVDVHVANLRKKLGDGRHLVETVRGIGYRLGTDAA